jgi:hypothetical protein
MRLSTQKQIYQMPLEERLARIAKIIEAVDDRCMVADGPISPTMTEMDQTEMSEIYHLACGIKVK